MVSAMAILALSAAVAACAPPPAPPGPPPPPPKFKLEAGLWHTFGTAPGATECNFVRVDGEGRLIPGSEVHSKTGQRYVEVGFNDSELMTHGCQKWVKADGPEDVRHQGTWPPLVNGRCPTGSKGFRGMAGDGDYRIGNLEFCDEANWTGDIPYGLYQLSNGPTCKFELLRNFRGEYQSTWISGDGTQGNGPGTPLGGWVPGTSIVIPRPSPQGPGIEPIQTISGLRLTGCGTPPSNVWFWGIV
jgi:hypothetical protein